jgi:hypothetical protein
MDLLSAAAKIAFDRQTGRPLFARHVLATGTQQW